jgi:hypothetical protein
MAAALGSGTRPLWLGDFLQHFLFCAVGKGHRPGVITILPGHFRP